MSCQAIADHRERFLKIENVGPLVGMNSEHILALVKTSQFPKPIGRGSGKRWVLSEINAWIEKHLTHSERLTLRARHAVAAERSSTGSRNAPKTKRGELVNEIEALERLRDSLMVHVELSKRSLELTGSGLFTEEIIAKKSLPWAPVCGVYFLVKSQRVVYVGQSVNVHARIAGHYQTHDFDSASVEPCKKEYLDWLESVYIHLFQPPLNGRRTSGIVNAPIPLHLIVPYRPDLTENGERAN